MNIISQSYWIFLSIIASLALVAIRPGLVSMGLFILVTGALLIYQVVIVLMDDSDILEEELVDYSEIT